MDPYLLANAADIKGEEVLRVLLYQDSKAVPMISLLENLWATAQRCCWASVPQWIR